MVLGILSFGIFAYIYIYIACPQVSPRKRPAPTRSGSIISQDAQTQQSRSEATDSCQPHQRDQEATGSCQTLQNNPQHRQRFAQFDQAHPRPIPSRASRVTSDDIAETAPRVVPPRKKIVQRAAKANHQHTVTTSCGSSSTSMASLDERLRRALGLMAETVQLLRSLQSELALSTLKPLKQ